MTAKVNLHKPIDSVTIRNQKETGPAWNSLMGVMSKEFCVPTNSYKCDV